MKPSSYLIILLMCAFIATTNDGVCLAQNRTIDSLNAALAAAKDDTIKIKILRDLNSEYWKHTQPDSALYSYRRALSIAEKLDDKYWYGMMLNEMASYYNQCGIYDSSFVYQNKALQIALQIKNNKVLRGYYSAQMSLYIGLQDYRKAMTSVQKALYYAELEGDSTLIAWAYANIGGVFRYQKLYDSALIYTNKGFALRKKMEQRTTERGFININNIGRSFRGLAEILVSQGRYQEARPYLDSAILFLPNSGLLTNLARVYLLSSIVWKEVGNLDSSLFYVQEAINLAEGYGGRSDLQQSYGHLADIYAQTGRYKEAFEYQKSSIYLKDSLNLTTLRQSISVMEIAEQIALQEKAVEEERRVRNIWVVGFGGVLIVAL